MSVTTTQHDPLPWADRFPSQEFIHYLQDTIDQRGIVRNYTVFNHEIRTGKNVKQLIMRAAQFSRSEPMGPSYLIASRECLEEKIEPYTLDVKKWKPLAPRGLNPDSVDEICDRLINAESAVVVTTYLGRDPETVRELVKFCEATGTAVLVGTNKCVTRRLLTLHRKHYPLT